MCDQKLYTQCETTQVREHGTGAALSGFSTFQKKQDGMVKVVLSPDRHVRRLRQARRGDMSARRLRRPLPLG